jgi:hypothetical protein
MHALLRMPPDAAAVKLDELKERVRKNFRRLALELHPDRTGGDPVKTERFKLLVSVKDEFEKLQLAPSPAHPQIVRPPTAPPVRVVRVVSWVASGSAYTKSAPTATVVGAPFNVATMKPT